MKKNEAKPDVAWYKIAWQGRSVKRNRGSRMEKGLYVQPFCEYRFLVQNDSIDCFDQIYHITARY